MKNILKLFLFSIVFFSCSSSDTDLNMPIEGKWQLVQELYYDFQDPDNQHFVENGYVIDFLANKRFISNRLENYENGVYTGGRFSISQDSILTIRYTANSYPDRVEQKKIVEFRNSNTELIISSDLTGENCIEGCGERFQKITDTSSN